MTGASGSWSVDLAPERRSERSEHTARWLRRGLIGTLAGLGRRGDRPGAQPACGRRARAPACPRAGRPRAPRSPTGTPRSSRRSIRTLTVGTSPAPARAARPEQPERDARRRTRPRPGPSPAGTPRPSCRPARPTGSSRDRPAAAGRSRTCPTGWHPGRWRRRARPRASRPPSVVRRRSTAGSPATARPCPSRPGPPPPPEAVLRAFRPSATGPVRAAGPARRPPRPAAHRHGAVVEVRRPQRSLARPLAPRWRWARPPSTTTRRPSRAR